MIMAKTVDELIAQAKKWIGYNEKDGSFHEIIDIYNSYKPRARGYTMGYNDAWCAAFVSACAIKTGNNDIIPPECSCYFMVKNFKILGEWDESDSRKPSPGDIIFYDWQDSGTDNNTGTPDHVGIVEKVSGTVMTVIEGNYNDAVGRRRININAKYIRGYGVPKYNKGYDTEHKTNITVEEAAKNVIKGIYGNGETRRDNITRLGLDYTAVQSRVNELLKAGQEHFNYTVKSGDTLSAIAKKYGTTVNAILALNKKITDKNKIYIGEQIQIK